MSQSLLRSQCAQTRISTKSRACRVFKVSRARLHVRATAQRDSEPNTPSQPSLIQPQQQPFIQSLQSFVTKYEGNALASSVGVLSVTGWCVLHGQDPATAAGISVGATIMALVLNEVLFGNE